MGDQKRFVPHEHQCYICGKLDGCEDEACEAPRTPWVCAKKTCRRLAESGVVHLAGANQRARLACCGLLPSETPRQDRAAGDPAAVTCRGRGAAAAATAASVSADDEDN